MEQLSCCRTDCFYMRFMHPVDTHTVGRQGKVAELCLHLTFGQLFALGAKKKKKRAIGMLPLLYLGRTLLYMFIAAYQQQSCNVKNICDARVTCTDHGVTQYRGGLAQFVLRDSAVEQDGLQQAGVVQVDVIVPFLRLQNTHLLTLSAAITVKTKSTTVQRAPQ